MRRERPLCRSVGLHQIPRVVEVTASPLPFCRFATFPLIGESSPTPTGMISPPPSFFFEKCHPPRQREECGRFVKRPYRVCAPPLVYTYRRDSPCGCPRVAEVGDPYGIFVSRSLSQKFSISICKKSVCRFGLHTLFAILFLRFLRHYGQSINLP